MLHSIFLVSSLGLIAYAYLDWICFDNSGIGVPCRNESRPIARPWCIRKNTSKYDLCPTNQELFQYDRFCNKLTWTETLCLAEETWCCGAIGFLCDTTLRKCGSDRRCRSDWCYRGGRNQNTTCPRGKIKNRFNDKCRGLIPGDEKWIDEYTYCCNNEVCPRYAVVLQICSAKIDDGTTVICDGTEGNPASSSCLKSGKTNSICLPKQNPYRAKCVSLYDGETMWLDDSLWCCRGVGGSKVDCDTGIRKCGWLDAKCNSTWCFGKRTKNGVETSCPSEKQKAKHNQICKDMKANEEKWIDDGTFCCNSVECQGKAEPPQKCSKSSFDDTSVSCNDGYGYLTSSCIKSENGSSTCLPKDDPYEKECVELMPGQTMWLNESLWCCRGNERGSKIDCDTGIRKCGNDTKCKSEWCIGENVNNSMTTTCPSETEKKDLNNKCGEIGDKMRLILTNGDVCCKDIECNIKKNGVSKLLSISYFSILNLLVIVFQVLFRILLS